MTYGYCRISTKQQSIERQIRNIKAAYPDAEIVEEAFTGTKIERPAFIRKSLEQNSSKQIWTLLTSGSALFFWLNLKERRIYKYWKPIFWIAGVAH